MRIISASAGSMAGVTVADGELLARRRRWHAGKRAGSVCQTAGKPGGGVVGVGVGGGEAGRLILGVGGQGGQREGVAVWCGLGVVLFLLSQMEFGSAHLL